MKEKNINFYFKNKKVKLKVCVVPGWFRGIGLMFNKKKNAKALLFEFKKPVRMAIHSWFVFFPFLAVWIDGHGKVIFSKIVKPFTNYVLPSVKFTKLVEIPLNGNYKSFESPSIKRKI